MIQIKKLLDGLYCHVSLYDPSHTYVGEIRNDFQFNDVRIQIKKQQLQGYYVIYLDKQGNEYKILINEDGRCSEWPLGFFDMFETQLMELL